MSRFAKTVPVRVSRTEDTKNRAGGQAFKQDSKQALVNHLLTSFVQDTFYRSEQEGIKDLRDLVGKVDPLFAAKASIYARDKFGMRSVTHIVGGEIPARVKGEKWTKKYLRALIKRPDDATEILAYYLATHGKPIPNSLKKGLSLGLARFNEYQLAKYRGENNSVKLVDLVNLVHVKPSEKNAVALEKLVDGELRSADTWESKLSEAGNSENKVEAKADAWGELLSENKLGFLAALRNLRNIESQAPQYLDQALAVITNPEIVKRSRVLPFQFLVAYDAIVDDRDIKMRNINKIVNALNDALELVFDNVPVFDGETLVVYDSSGSMTMARAKTDPRTKRVIRTKPTATYAAVFVAALAKKNNADIMQFDRDGRYNYINTRDSFTTIRDQVLASCRGGSTDAGSIFRTANKKYDRIIILSDHQSWSHPEVYSRSYGHWNRPAEKVTPEKERQDYKRRTGSDPWIYSFDLAGLGTLSFPEQDRKVLELAGYSDKVFETMKFLEQDRYALIREIESIEF